MTLKVIKRCNTFRIMTGKAALWVSFFPLKVHFATTMTYSSKLFSNISYQSINQWPQDTWSVCLLFCRIHSIYFSHFCIQSPNYFPHTFPLLWGPIQPVAYRLLQPSEAGGPTPGPTGPSSQSMLVSLRTRSSDSWPDWVVNDRQEGTQRGP